MSRRPIRPPSSSASQEEAGQDTPWLYAYGSLVTVLLLFMIMMVTIVGLREIEAPSEDPQHTGLAKAREEFEQSLAASGLNEGVSIDSSADRLIIRLESVLLFELGKADLSSKSKAVLQQVGQLLQKLPNAVRVEGHTDDLPISSPRFPSNWELSTARAISVVLFLEESGVARSRLSAAGYGEHHPLTANVSKNSRRLNRRVEVVVIGQ